MFPWTLLMYHTVQWTLCDQLSCIEAVLFKGSSGQIVLYKIILIHNKSMLLMMDA